MRRDPYMARHLDISMELEIWKRFFFVNPSFIAGTIARIASTYYSGNMEIISAVSVMSALAQATRLRCYLKLTEAGEMTAGELASTLGVPANTMSSHLTILSTARLVTSHRNGRNIIYRAEAAVIDELKGFLNNLARRSG